MAHITIDVKEDTHQALKAFAKTRRISLMMYVKEVLDWASKQDLEKLLAAGMQLPVWPGEVKQNWELP
jgi:hypothetical protein